MTRGEIHDYALTMPHAGCTYKEEWGAFLYMLDGKYFLLIGENPPGTAIMTMKCSPARAEELRDAYPEIIPGYYSNKKHWNTIPVENSLSDNLIKELIAHAYEMVLGSLPKKRQEELRG